MFSEVDQLAINSLRILSAEMIEKAKSGHPGMPLGIAPSAFVLWSKFLKHNPKNPKWFNRDRFVLSAGHASSLLYSLLYLFGYSLELDDLKKFRQWDSITPGHPEYGKTPGVEVTTGPLGQGIANAVGMALAESYLAAKFNRPGFNLVNHFTYTLCGDGCLMEGVSAEAASLAGTLKLGKLIVLYDSNGITIEGSTEIAFGEDVLKRFEAYNWQILKVSDGNNLSEIYNAISQARKNLKQPSIIEIKTQIGYGAPNKQGKSCAHGEPLGKKEIDLLKENLDWNHEDGFFVPNRVLDYMEQIKETCESYETDWNNLFESYKNKYADLAKKFIDWQENNFDINLISEQELLSYNEDLATRVSSEIILNKISTHVENLFGGSADLAPSTKSVMKDREFYSCENRTGSNVHFGVREHAMSAIANGLALHGGLRVYISGFFVFSDYMKPAMRLAALMGLPVINIFTHDSIGVGEDGPTHQPVEQLAMLRSTPNFDVMRPCDSKETAVAWQCALNKKTGPSALILSRQKLKLLKETGIGALKGAYVLKDSNNPEVILMASGSEVSLICDVYDELKKININARVVSMFCCEIFDRQTEEYKNGILKKDLRARLAVEAGASFGWHKYVGLDGKIISVDKFGSSAPSKVLFDKYNFTVDNIVKYIKELLNK